jgi:cyclopropane fatty-acyl-phospholipid synthase-like methyltransferase
MATQLDHAAGVFPAGEPLPLPVMLSAAQGAGFEVRHVDSLRPHYARTLRPGSGTSGALG